MSERDRLTRCPDCGKEVSIRATTCPHCGAPLNRASGQQGKDAQKNEMSTAGRVICVIIGLALLIYGISTGIGVFK